MEKKHEVLGALIVAVLAFQAQGYKETTHADIAKHAIERSALNEPSHDVLTGLGLGESLREQRLSAPGAEGAVASASVVDLVMRGAREEDHGIRSLRHFFDPQRDGAGVFFFDPSPTWALTSDSDSQEFALNDANTYLLGALTGPTEYQRSSDLSRVFRVLGQVMHHLQDMHQPQHTRSDLHCDDSPVLAWAVPLPRGCETVFVDDVFHRPSAYEQYVWEQGVVPMDGYPVPDYATFDAPRKFWENAGMGGAEFTSNNFVSAKTNFRLDASTSPVVIRSESEHPLPRGADARTISVSINDPSVVRRVTSPQPMAGEISFVETPIADAYNPSFSGLNNRSSTLSIWYDSFFAGPSQVSTPIAGFTLNSVNYQAAMQRLLPRAAAYSTGLINYFFRGRIEIGLPQQGVYGVIDHATTYAVGQGFDKLKLKLRNASPDGVKPSGERVPQTMQGGTLVAVAKYTLNSCYQRDLTGDFGSTLDTGQTIYPANCTLDQYFAGEELISQSAAQLAVTLDTTAADFTFDFSSQPIPVNARDLRIQVVYTGQLGAETDGIAFGGRDISEPTHLMIYNNSDYYAVDGRFYTPAQIRADGNLSQRVQSFDIDPKLLVTVALTIVPGSPITGSAGPVPVNGYVRVAVLADLDDPFDLHVLTRFEGGGFTESTFAGVWANDTHLRTEPAYVTPFGIYRGARAQLVDVAYKANSTVPLQDGELVGMSTRTVPDPGPTQIPLRF